MRIPIHAIPAELAAVCRSANRVVVLTGAGMSAESGIATFRDAPDALWAKYNPMDLATPEAFSRDPKLVWSWYAWRREQVRAAEPHAGHQALAAWQSRAEVTIVTQNVDGLHQRAGSSRVYELHGSIMRCRCFDHDHPCESWQEIESGAPPQCVVCASPLRPDVVWFGEMLPEAALRGAFEAITGADLVLSVGTSTLVQPAASLPFEAIRAGKTVVEINPTETPLSAVADFSIDSAASVSLEVLTGSMLSA